jgi:hypothetical protein
MNLSHATGVYQIEEAQGEQNFIAAYRREPLDIPTKTIRMNIGSRQAETDDARAL